MHSNGVRATALRERVVGGIRPDGLDGSRETCEIGRSRLAVRAGLPA